MMVQNCGLNSDVQYNLGGLNLELGLITSSFGRNTQWMMETYVRASAEVESICKRGRKKVTMVGVGLKIRKYCNANAKLRTANASVNETLIYR